MRFQL